VSNLSRVRGPERVIVAAWLAVLLAATAVFLSAGWEYGCQDRAGNHLSGIDCFQYDALPTAHSEPAASLGFVPLVATWFLAVLVISGLLVSAGLRARREAVDE
jgi:hypothetical protein